MNCTSIAMSYIYMYTPNTHTYTYTHSCMPADTHVHVHVHTHVHASTHTHTPARHMHHAHAHAYTYHAFTNDFVIVRVSICVWGGDQTSTHTTYMYTGQLSQPISHADWKVHALHAAVKAKQCA